jgi:hypothetical protein
MILFQTIPEHRSPDMLWPRIDYAHLPLQFYKWPLASLSVFAAPRPVVV